MQLLPLVRSHAPAQVQAPPEVWEALIEESAAVLLLASMIAAACRLGASQADLTLSLANIVVQEDAYPDDPSRLTPGEYVGLTVAGPGAWSSDWSWAPGGGSPPVDLLSATLLARAAASFAYGRSLGSGSSLTILLPRHDSRSPAPRS